MMPNLLGKLTRPSVFSSASTNSSAAKKLALFTLVGATGLLLCSGVRHFLLRSGAEDLGIFDQAVYLISQGKAPISSLLGYHILGDHASLALYPYSLSYLIWPNAYMLLIVQALVLAIGAYPVWRLARLGGVPTNLCFAIVIAYLMFPLIVISNIFDFHPEILVVPTLLMAVLAARENRRVSFIFWILLTLSPKEIISITVAATGLYLLLIEKRRFHGLFALVAGAVWFIIASKLIIPHFGNGKNPSGIGFYSYLGSSIGEILLNSIIHPQLWMRRLVSGGTIVYLLFILAPMWWAAHPRTLLPLLAAVPAILLNLLSSFPDQHRPFAQYMLPIIPFIFVAIVDAVAAQRTWLRRPAAIVTWSIAMLVLGAAFRLARLQAGQALDLQTIHDVKHAVALIPSEGAVLTTFEITPRLSHREVITYIGNPLPRQSVDHYDYILINTQNSSLLEPENVEESKTLLAMLGNSPDYEAVYTTPNVFLYRHAPTISARNASQ